MKTFIKAALLIGGLTGGMSIQEASASFYTVYASANSSSGGAPMATISLSAGQWFAVSASPTDLWNAGPLPRWSNANGLIGNLYATGSDDSGQSAGTLIGQSFGMYTVGSFSAPYGALVGEIAGNYILLGTSYSGLSPATGTLNLLYWDSNNGDNTEQLISVNVTAVPEPATMIAGALLSLPFGASTIRILRKNRAA